MRIAVDVSAAAGRPVGIGVYAISLARALARLVPEDLIVFWMTRPGMFPPDLPEGIRRRGWPIPYRLVASLWWKGWPPSADLLSGNPDVFHSTGFVAPVVRKAALVQTVHDLSFFRLPEMADAPPPGRETYRRLLGRARLLVADSAFTASELEACLPGGLPPVRVVPCGVDHARFRPLQVSDQTRVLGRLGLSPGDYLLSVGTLQPRKNLPRLLEAWEGLPDGSRPRLVLVGGRGWKSEGLLERLSRKDLLWLEDLPSADLPALYAGALAFCYPSLYEGFGLPILEAMASGAPVLTSDRSSMPEVAEKAARLVDPESVEALRAALTEIIGDADLRRRLRELGLARAADFSWDRTAREMMAVYREAIA